jgi:hypothetical protein
MFRFLLLGIYIECSPRFGSREKMDEKKSMVLMKNRNHKSASYKFRKKAKLLKIIGAYQFKENLKKNKR